MSARLADRVRRIRAQALVRAWQFRQRNHAHGVWYRLRRLLAGARSAHAISDRDARDLLNQGLSPEPAGSEIEPQKLIFAIPQDRLTRIASARELPLRLGPEMLDARSIVLVPFHLPDRNRPARPDES